MSAARATAAALAAVVLATATAQATAQTVFSLDSAEAAVRRTHPQIERPVVATTGLRERRDLTYASPGGQALQLDLVRPADDRPRPVLLLVHGGGWEAGSRQMEAALARALAARGWAVAAVSTRLGADGRYPAPLHDLQAALRWLREQARELGLDAGRVAAIGASSGGQLVALLGARNDAGVRLSAVVDIDGLADFTDPAFVAAQAATPSAPTRFLGGPYAQREAVWREASALTHAGAHSAPTLFIDSTAPTPMLPGRDAMQQRLRAAGVAAERVTLPDTPHPFWLFEPWFGRVVALCDDFLRRQLGAP